MEDPPLDANAGWIFLASCEDGLPAQSQPDCQAVLPTEPRWPEEQNHTNTAL